MIYGKKISAFIKLGNFLSYFINDKTNKERDLLEFYPQFEELIKTSFHHNGWFTEDNVRTAISSISQNLTKEKLEKWLKKYHEIISNKNESKRIAVITAGNIPMVGFHDMICVLVTGNVFIGKLSSQDNKLLPFIGNILLKIEPEFKNHIFFTENKLEKFDKIIATGSDNTSRYFEYYFGKYPHVIRKHRNSIAVISGKETNDELEELAKDIFLYFGLGCRNVSKIFVPENFNFEKFFEAIKKFVDLCKHNKYMNNYDYYKAIYLINTIEFKDNGFMMLMENPSLSSPVSVVYYEKYHSIKDVLKKIEASKNNIQCIVSKISEIKSKTDFGKTQFPELWDYADNIDTIEFLTR
ncbi:MAG: acyl-CoA reductase [Bacteroidales bacterium]|nr:acyl-CoA reductase [Bacteroidales bacterium]